jgi:hypothetical protein
MGVAPKIILDAGSTVNFNVPRDLVWKLLNEPSQWNETKIYCNKINY